MWFFHHRLFSQFFVPKTWPILLNFAWLGLLVLLVYFTLLYVNPKLAGDPVIMRLYFGGYALAYAILGAQYLIGMRYLRDTLDQHARAQGRRGAAFMFLWMTPFLFCFIVVIALPASPLLGMLIGLAFVGVGIASGVLGSRYRRSERTLSST